jgi:uncharacterized membrane protein
VAITNLLFTSYLQICDMLGVVPLGMNSENIVPLKYICLVFILTASLCIWLDKSEIYFCNLHFRLSHAITC